MAFDPDAFLADTKPTGKSVGFDPDAFIAETATPEKRSFLETLGEILSRDPRGKPEEAAATAKTVGAVGHAAATIPVSAAKLVRLINPLDKVSRVTPTEEALAQFAAENLDETTAPIEMATKIAGTAGVGGGMGKVITALSQSPKALALAEALRTGGMGTQAAGLPTRMLAGSTVGGVSDLMTGGEGGAGAAIGMGLPVVQKLTGVGVGKVYDALVGKGKDVRAGKVMRDVAGDKLDEIKGALAGQGDDITAAQAAEKAGSTRFSALGKRAERMNSEYFNDLEKAQEAKRLASLEGVMPDLKDAEKARETISEINYNKAFASDAQRRFAEQQTEQAARGISSGGISGFSPKPAQPIPEVVNMAGNPIIDSAAKEASILARSQGKNIGDPRASLEGLHYMKLAIDNQFKNKSASTALQSYSDEALGNTKKALLNIIEGTDDKAGISPLYKIARERHKELSKPVNQSKVIQAMIDVMKKSTGGERVTPFLDVMGRGENALLKRADQSARFGGIEDVLTPTQMGARNKVASEMIRDVNLEDLASRGTEDLANVLRKDAFHTTIPNYISWKLSAAKRGLDITEEFLNEKTMKRVYEAMKTPQGALDLINTLPAHERTKVLKFVTEMNSPVITPAATVDKRK